MLCTSFAHRDRRDSAAQAPCVARCALNDESRDPDSASPAITGCVGSDQTSEPNPQANWLKSPNFHGDVEKYPRSYSHCRGGTPDAPQSPLLPDRIYLVITSAIASFTGRIFEHAGILFRYNELNLADNQRNQGVCFKDVVRVLEARTFRHQQVSRRRFSCYRTRAKMVFPEPGLFTPFFL